MGCKWNTNFWFVLLEIYRNKLNFWKGSPVFPVESSQWKFVFHLQICRLCDQSQALHGLLRALLQQRWRFCLLIPEFKLHNELHERQKVFLRENCWPPKWLWFELVYITLLCRWCLCHSEEVTFNFIYRCRICWQRTFIIARGVLPYKGLMGTCGFRYFCLKQSIDYYHFVLNRVFFLGKFLKQGILLGKMS